MLHRHGSAVMGMFVVATATLIQTAQGSLTAYFLTPSFRLLFDSTITSLTAIDRCADRG